MSAPVWNDFWPVSSDTMTRAQFYDCKTCRAIVIDWLSHSEWHRMNREEGGE